MDIEQAFGCIIRTCLYFKQVKLVLSNKYKETTAQRLPTATAELCRRSASVAGSQTHLEKSEAGGGTVGAEGSRSLKPRKGAKRSRKENSKGFFAWHISVQAWGFSA